MLYRKRLSFITTLLFVNGILAQTNKPQTNVTQVPAPTHAVAASPGAYSNSVPVNYVRTRQARYPFTSENQFNAGNQTQRNEITQYMDGLGRALQTVNKQAAPGQKDMVSPVHYDGFGRVVYQYLPFVPLSGTQQADGSFKTDPYPLQEAFFQQQTSLQGEQVYYGVTQYEQSPLNRVLQTQAAGNSWAGSNRGSGNAYLLNDATDEVRIWTIGYDTLSYLPADDLVNLPQHAGIYATGRLTENQLTDEAGNRVVEYKDVQGKVILKKVQIDSNPSASHTGWLCTYYVYDDLGQLRFVIPPKAVEALQQQSWTLSSSVAQELCFRYEYDNKGRMIAKKVPGAGWVYMVYDERDRLCFTQDANMQQQSVWMGTWYDGLNRPRLTGIIYYNDNRSALQYWMNSHFTNAEGTLTVNTGSNENITVWNNSLPAGHNLKPLTVTYYDNYEHTSRTYTTTDNHKIQAGAANQTHTEALPSSAWMQVTGLSTGSKIKVIENPDNLDQGGWLESTQFYDEKGRVVQVQSDHYRGGTDITTSRYDFTGKVVASYQYHQNSAAAFTLRTLTQMEYDAEGRLLNIIKTLNDSTQNQRYLVRNTYDAMGQLIQKKLGQKKSTDTTAMEVQDYAYNIRGWLQGLNREYSRGNNTRWFGMELNYDWGYTQNQYNGNIAGMQWRSGGDAERRSYGYGYDRANRLLFGDFTQYNGTAYADNGNINFDVLMGNGQDYSAAYDANGNILRMQQWGMKLNASARIDDLQYNYWSQSNKLKNVLDAENDTLTRLGDFRSSTAYMASLGSKTSTVTDYTYDENGNLVKDLNKDIVRVNGGNGIKYNHLNLPFEIKVKKANGDSGIITYVYDAAGTKLRKKVVENNDTTITDYLGGQVYRNDSLQFVQHEEGRVRQNLQGQWVYDYFIKDHLGNTRVLLTEEYQRDPYPVASLETATLGNEQLYYTIPDGGSVRVNKSTIADYPTDAYTNPNDFVHKLNGSGTKVGTSMVLKVMAGDTVWLHAKSWYRLNGNSPGSPASPLSELIAALAGGVSNMGGGKFSYTDLVNNNILSPGLSSMLGSQTDASGKPRAFLNWVLFDEQFNFVSTASGFDRVGSDDELKTHSVSDLTIPRNGYLYIYVSNETPNVDVIFDNLQVTHSRGPLMEETHYYPFGLTMAGISSKAAGKLENRFKFGGKELQSNEFSDNNGLELYDFQARNYDPQLGRFWGGDKKADKLVQWSPYTYCLNNPLSFVDPDGEFPWPISVRSFISASSVAGGLFKGDGRGPSVSTDRTTTTSRTFVNFTYDPQKKALTNKSVGADNTIMYAPPEAGMGDKYPLVSKTPEPKATFTEVSTEKNSLGNDIGSFGVSYAAKDPVTPGFATPSLDVQSNFSITENLKTGTLSVNATFTGDVFPSTEAFISDQSGVKLFLGAKKETGGIKDLFGDNKKSLFTVNMQIKFDSKGNFTGVQQGDKLINIADWNKQVQATWSK
ncbi:DUF6443 domain-containing protein [Sediminibacterium sp.]|uniref:DUF6443 domain-containing protein n=1 Tax=Sediminibacterium sp. TaxID=1917865 RepID=UPI0025DBC0A6|nr:DUF6443 domain-containing protein [Sediminibacterium sp.]MBW0176594.1 hypothetical protein [Sediminibacterium sp.]